MTHPALRGAALGTRQGVRAGGDDSGDRMPSLRLILLSHLSQPSGILAAVSTGLISVYIWEMGFMEALSCGRYRIKHTLTSMQTS